MYKVDEYIIYQNGVGHIIEQNQDKMIILRYPNQERIEISLSQVIRRICDLKTIEEVVDRIAYTCTLSMLHERFRQDVYQEAMNSYDELEWIKVIKTEYVRSKMNKSQDFEKKFAKQAKYYLYSEISILLNISYDTVEKYIHDYIHNDIWE